MPAVPVAADQSALLELELLAAAMRRHRDETKLLAARRNAVIRRALAAGLSQTRVGELLGMTRQAIARHAEGGNA